MSKMGLHDLFWFLKHKLWPKEGLGVELTIWLPTIKSQESPWFPWVQVACYILLERQGLQLCIGPHFDQSQHKKLWASKVVGVLILRISRFQLGSPGTKWHLGAGPVTKHREYYKGEGAGFPQVRAVVSLGSLCLPVARSCTKSAATMHYLTCCLVCAGPCE
jgi:hypothetical protein